MAHDICWIELTTDNQDAAKGFYGELFGWTYEESPMEQGGEYAMFQPQAGGPGGGIMTRPKPEMPTAWMPYVAVDDLDASVDRVKALGGTVHMGPTPVADFGAFAVIADPSGGVMGLWKSTCCEEK